MTVALEIFGSVALLFIGLLFFYAFVDVHRDRKREEVIRLSALPLKMNFWGADTVGSLRRILEKEKNCSLKIVDDIGLSYPLKSSQIGELQEKYGLSEEIIVDYCFDKGYICVIINKRK